MDRTQAYALLSQCLESHRDLGWSELRRRLGSTETHEVRGSASELYSIEIKFQLGEKGRGITISGKIHANNSFAWSVLEERIHLPQPAALPELNNLRSRQRGEPDRCLKFCSQSSE